MASEPSPAMDTANTILVADDDFYMRELVKVALDNTASMVEASAGQDVVDLYKKHHPSMVFLDIHMPGMDGKTILKEILQLDNNAYVVMISADSTKVNVEETQYKGAKGFVAKPFTKDTIMRHFERCQRIKTATKPI